MGKVTRWIAIWIAVVGLLFAGSTTGWASQPRSPITVDLTIPRAPALNEKATATIRVTSTRDAPGTTVELLLPEGSVASRTTWTVDLVAGKTVTFTSSFSIRKLGNATVSARARKEFGPQDAWGDMKSIPMTIRTSATLPNLLPSQRGASSKGWSVDALPRAERLPPRTDAERLGPALAPVTSVAPIPFKWPRNAAQKTEGPLPSTTPGFRLPALAPIATPAGTVTLTGNWYYNDRSGTQRGVDQQLIEVRKGDGSQMSPNAVFCFTDGNGAYSCNFDPGTNGSSFVVWLRTWTNIGNRLGVFSGPETAGGCGNDSIGCSYPIPTGTISCSVGQTCGVGSYTVNSSTGDPWLGAVWMTQDMIRVWKRLYFDVGAMAGPGRMSFPVPSGHGTHAHVPPADGWIAIEPPAHTSAHPSTHEYGHVVMANQWANFGTTWPPFDCGSSHDIPDATGPGCALSEGWADFWSAYGTGDPAYLYTGGGSISNFETRSGYRAWASGDWVEGNVAAVMWDMYDGTNDGPDTGLKDRLTDGIAKVWATMTTAGTNGFAGWWSLYQGKGYAPCPALEIIRYDTINYSLGGCSTYTVSASAGAGGSASGGGTYMNGTSVTVTATPSGGNGFINWTENGSPVSTSASYTFTVSSGRSLVANFSAPADITSPTPYSALLGSSVTFNWNNGSGATGYFLAVGTSPGDHSYYYTDQGTNHSATVTGLPVDGRTIYVRLYSMINGSYQYRDFVYAAATASVMTSPSPGSTLPGSTVTFNWSAGTSVTNYFLSIGNQPGASDHTWWYQDEGSSRSQTVTGLPMDGRVLYVRLYSLIGGSYVWNDFNYSAATQTWAISVSASPPAGGSVNGGGTFANGASRTVTASPNAGYVFTNWTENGSVVSSSASYTFTLSASRTLVANFAQTYTVSVSASPPAGGTVTGGGTFTAGTSRAVDATANAGYTFVSWTENGSVVSNTASYGFQISGNRTLVANFAQVYSVSVSASPPAGGTVGGSGTFTAGTSRTVTATANSGYTFTNWTENGGAVSSSPSYTFSLSANRTLVGNFAQASASATALSVSPNPSVIGRSVTLTATVAPVAPATGTPTGTVTFKDGTTTLGSTALSSGATSLAVSNLPVGSHQITAVYGGGGAFSTSTSAVKTLTVNKGATTTTAGATPSTVAPAAGPTLKAQIAVTAPAAASPTGTVTFTENGATIASVAVSGGSAQAAIAPRPIGTHHVTALYSGDAKLTASSVGFDYIVSAAIGTEVQVDTTTAGAQQLPAVAKLASGWVVTWASDAQDGSGYGIFAQRYTAVGAKAGAEFPVNAYKTGQQTNPAVAGLGNDGFVIVWQSAGQDGSGYGIFGQRYTSAGAVSGGAFRINSAVVGDQTDPSVAALSGGGFVVTWTTRDGTDLGVYARRYDATGAAASAAFRVNTTTAGDQSMASVAGLAGGGFVVVWQSALQDTSGLGIYARRYDAVAAPLSGEFRVNGTVASNQSLPSIGGLSNGGFVVTWQSAPQDGAGYGVYAQRYSATGVRAGGETRVNTTTAGNQSAARIIGFGDGGYVVVWASSGQDGSGDGVYAQAYKNTGVKANVEFRVNTVTAGHQNQPDAAAFGSGNFVVVWTSKATDGTLENISMQRFKLPGTN